jgi:PAS domain S-box-containing protein
VLTRSNLNRLEGERARLAEAEAALRVGEERLRLAIEGTGIGTFDLDPDSGAMVWSPQHFAIFGYPPQRDGLATRAMWCDRLHEEDRPRVMRAYEAPDRGAFRVVHRIVRADTGAVRWIETLGQSIDNGGGGGMGSGGRRRRRVVGVVRDVTERREVEEGRELLVRELSHRVKNTLAAVQAIVDQIRRTAGSPAVFQDALSARLRALARAHDTLTQEGWRGATLGDVVRGALEPYAGTPAGSGTASAASAAVSPVPRVALDGPAVRLTASAAVALAMVLHELASNAAKHGALSAPGGRVHVTWALTSEALDVAWTEQGGPPIAGPPAARRGFGSILLDRVLVRQFGGRLALDFAPTGLRCRMRLPLSERLLAA